MGKILKLLGGFCIQQESCQNNLKQSNRISQLKFYHKDKVTFLQPWLNRPRVCTIYEFLQLQMHMIESDQFQHTKSKTHKPLVPLNYEHAPSNLNLTLGDISLSFLIHLPFDSLRLAHQLPVHSSIDAFRSILFSLVLNLCLNH